MGDTTLLKGGGSVVDIQGFVDDIEALTLYDTGQQVSSDQIEKTNNLIKQRCIKELHKLVSRLAVSTVASYLCGYRKAIDERFEGKKVFNTGLYKNRHPGHLAKTLMVLDQSSQKILKVEQSLGLEQKLQSNVIIKDTVGYLKMAHGLMSSQYWHDVAIGLMAVTGRRVSEVYKTAKFSACKKDWELGSTMMQASHSVMFNGQLKKRQEEFETYPIPVLAHPQDVIKAVKQLRFLKDYSKVAVPVVNSRVSTQSSQYIREYLGQYVDGYMTAKTCRDIYVVLATALCTDYKTIRLLGFFARHVLGHDGSGAALNYMPASIHRTGFKGARDYMAEVWGKYNA